MVMICQCVLASFWQMHGHLQASSEVRASNQLLTEILLAGVKKNNVSEIIETAFKSHCILKKFIFVLRNFLSISLCTHICKKIQWV